MIRLHAVAFRHPLQLPQMRCLPHFPPNPTSSTASNRETQRCAMHANLSLIELMDYTAWERRKLHERLQQRGDAVLNTDAGANSDRFATVGDIIEHISAEKRYIDRFSGRPLSDPVGVPRDSRSPLRIRPPEPQRPPAFGRIVPAARMGRPPGLRFFWRHSQCHAPQNYFSRPDGRRALN